jgi:hypothetical protein
MSTILASRYISGIRAEVEKVERQLSIFSDTLDQWVQVRAGWLAGDRSEDGCRKASLISIDARE